MTTCNQHVHGGGLCKMDPDHRGYHSTVVFRCESCGKVRRGRPTLTTRDGEYVDGLKFCFLCVLDAETER